MILLDTDHVSILQVPNQDRRLRLLARLDQQGSEIVGTTIVTIEEQMRGWLASIAKGRRTIRQATPYRELRRLFRFFADWHVAELDQDAIRVFEGLRSSGIRIGTMDTKIAAVALHHDALLLTANTRDFEKVPGLRFANWMDAGA